LGKRIYPKITYITNRKGSKESLNDDDLEISVYSPNCDVKPVAVQKISKDKIKQFNSE